VQLPDSITSIGWGAFEQNNRIAAIELPGELIKLGEYAFYQCPALTDVTFPEKLQEIGGSAFKRTNLREIYIPDSVRTIGEGAFWYCNNVERISIGGLETIETLMFATGSDKIQEVVIRGTVKRIGDSAFDSAYQEYYNPDNSYYRHNNGNFYHRTNTDARLIIEEGVETIGSYAFGHCHVFTEIQLPDSITSIGARSFGDCSRLSSLYVGMAQPNLQADSFAGCSVLKAYVDAENAVMREYFAQNNIRAEVLGEDNPIMVPLVIHANGGAFADGSETISRELPWMADIPQLEKPVNGEYPFTGWYLDAACTLKFTGERMPARGAELYAGWNLNRHKIILNGNGGLILWEGNQVDSVGLWAETGDQPVEGIAAFRDHLLFSGWYLDAECVQPFDGVMSDNDLTVYAGYTASSVNAEYEFENGRAKLISYEQIGDKDPEVYLPESVNGMPLAAIGPSAFAGEAIEKLVLPSGIADLDANAFAGMDRLKEIRVHPANTAYADDNGILMDKAATRLLLYPPQHENTIYRLPGSMRSIAPHAFEGSEIRSVILNPGLEEIGAYAFARTAISRLDLPDSLKTIDRCAFYDCANLSRVSTGAGLESVGDLAFFGCSGFMSISGPVSDCAIGEYARANGISYNMYLLTLCYPNGTQKQRTVQAGSAFILPADPAMPENSEFTGWYKNAGCTEAWTAQDVMPAGELTLYGGKKPVFTYESVEITTETEVTDEATGETTIITETHTALRITEYLSEKPEAIVPGSIGGVAVEQIGADCFGSHVTEVTVPEGVNQIEDGAFVNEDIRILCSEESKANEYAQDNNLTSQPPSRAIRFAANGGADIPAIMAEEGARIELPVPVRSGCEPAGWYLDAALKESVPLDEGMFIVPKQDVILYAAWHVLDEALANPGFTYVRKGSEITVTGLVRGTTELIIPETLHGMPVTGMEASAFRGEKELLSIQIPGSIKSIPAHAFRNCTALANIA
ncbi:MAG: leucine-rich repeat protein, partial [Clostridia bacterium]|nr:leucine-rich repeat protein [Clostridia bacterium]